MKTTYGKVSLSDNALDAIHLFRNLDPSERRGIVRLCEGRLYAKNRHVIAHGDGDGDVFFIVSGLIQAIVRSSSGHRLSTQLLGSGETFGELAALDRKGRSASVVTMEEALIARISESNFLKLLNTHPSIAVPLLTRLGKLVRFLCSRISELSPKREQASLQEMLP